MTNRQRFLILLLALAAGAWVASIVGLLQGAGVPAWIVFGTAGALAVISRALSAADRHERFFGLDQRGLARLRTTGRVVPARILEVTTDTQDEDGTVHLRMRVEVAPSPTERFITTTPAAITVTEIPRYQPGQQIAVRHLPEFPGVVTEERAPDADARRALETAGWPATRHAPGQVSERVPEQVTEQVTEHSGRMPDLTPSSGRAAASTLAVILTLLLGAAIGYAVILGLG